MNGLVLEGGGARGSYQVGAIKALRKKRIKIDYVVGTSVGSINAAFVASGQYRKLEELWKGFTSEELFGVDQQLISAFENKKITSDVVISGVQTISKIIKNSGIDTTKLKEALINNLDEEKFKKSKINYGLVTYNLSKREPIEIFKKDIPKGKLVEYLLASSYLPVFKFEKIIDNSFYIDGGLFNGCPVNMLTDKKLDKIYVVRLQTSKLTNGSKNIIEIKSNKKLGSIIAFDKETTQNKILLGYYDTLRVIDKLDGIKYYFKYKSENYYESLFDSKIKKQIIKKYNKNLLITNNKKIVINILEEICDYYKVKRFRIYNITLLVLKLKILNWLKKESFYSKFIKEIKVR